MNPPIDAPAATITFENCGKKVTPAEVAKAMKPNHVERSVSLAII